MNVYVFIPVTEGLVGDGVSIHTTMSKAKDAFKDYHGLEFDKVVDRSTEESARFDADVNTSDIVTVDLDEDCLRSFFFSGFHNDS